MLLRASGQVAGDKVDLSSVIGRDVGDGGVPHAGTLVGFVEAVLGEDDELLSNRRKAILEELGGEAFVDVAAVIAGFNAVDRIADATGIPLDENMREGSAEVRSELGLDAFASAQEA